MHVLPFPPPRGRAVRGHTPDLRPLSGSQLRNAFEVFHFDGEPPMAATAQIKPGFDDGEDHRLADDIARAMHHRPLMSRLARVEAAHGDAAVMVAKTATGFASPRAHEPAAIETPPPLPVADLRSIEELIDDLGYASSPPPSAEWLEKARRAKAHERRRHALAWVTTLAIAGVILTGTYVLLHV